MLLVLLLRIVSKDVYVTPNVREGLRITQLHRTHQVYLSCRCYLKNQALIRVMLSRHEKLWVSHEWKKLTSKINAGYLYPHHLETTLVYQFCCRCSQAKHAAKQG